ncbi:hypothetical protein [Streptomyces sp. 2231.1]|uniref:hypothetical protein n=1 Tax=Streptomyces sp. 2231.1 TaxID=1855347 RepID=UPI000ADB3489|nr:hypothetical protein [Streptomyces sp. 2231.1]
MRRRPGRAGTASGGRADQSARRWKASSTARCAALAFAQETQAGRAVAECLAATTTLWLPVYGLGAAVLVGTVAWFRDRDRARLGPGHH